MTVIKRSFKIPKGTQLNTVVIRIGERHLERPARSKLTLIFRILSCGMKAGLMAVSEAPFAVLDAALDKYEARLPMFVHDLRLEADGGTLGEICLIALQPHRVLVLCGFSAIEASRAEAYRLATKRRKDLCKLSGKLRCLVLQQRKALGWWAKRTQIMGVAVRPFSTSNAAISYPRESKAGRDQLQNSTSASFSLEFWRNIVSHAL